MALAGCGDEDKDAGAEQDPAAPATLVPSKEGTKEPDPGTSPSDTSPPDGGDVGDLPVIGGELEGTWAAGDTSLTSKSAQLTYRSAETGECTGVATDRDIALTSCDALDMADPNAFGAMNAVWSVKGDTVTVKWMNGKSQELTRQ
ncbi:hypothetical protein [Streptomyces sp. B8F3]|uniref:hypothetical protein n=1 Tax=unclassified Streptomyces TaxID=2593676 RepID=UPI00325EA46A